MELEFDKEIDAILRKARHGIGATAANAEHLDADMIAAFAENALPDQAKLLYVEHFADCDSCRRQLAFAMQVNNEAEPPAASSVSEPLAAASIPWYQSFSKAPNLALAMGGLVLAFSGVLGYLVIQKQNVSDIATVSQVTEPEKQRVGASLGDEGVASNAASANAMAQAGIAPAANSSANSATTMSGRGPNTGQDTLGRADADQAKPDAARENSFVIDGQEASGAKPTEKAAAPPPPVTTDATSSGIAMERDEKKQNDGTKLKEESKDLELAKKRQLEDRGYRDMPRAASKVGPSRSVVGPAQNQANQMNSNMPVTRVVGGKTFNNRDGAWYDSAYQNQATAIYRRSSVEYKKLDRGLRNIADTLGGTVVIVWKARAYRIQ